MNEANSLKESLKNASPLAKKIMAGVWQIAKGNGITQKDLTFISEENGRFKLENLLELHFEVTQDAKPKKSKDQQTYIYSSRAEMKEEMSRACRELMLSAESIAVIKDDILSRSGKGLESSNPVYPITGLHYNFGFKEPCGSCHGEGRGGCPVCHGKGQSVCPQCRGQKTEWCGHCQGTGRLNPQTGERTLQDPLCTYCRGEGHTQCLRCSGHGLTKCQPCNGSGHSHCRECGGVGEKEHVFGLSFEWRVQVHRLSLEPPRAVSHLLGKAPIGQLAVKGHVPLSVNSKPMMSPPNTDYDETRRSIKGNDNSLYYIVESDIPWCEAIVKIGDTPAFDVTAAGRKGRINHCAYFLDKYERGLKRLRHEALGKVLKLGIKKADRAVAKLYPIGLSERLRHDILKKSRQKIIQKTNHIRMGAWVLSFIITATLSWFITGWIGAVSGAIAGIIIFHALILLGKYQFARTHKLQYKPRPRFGWEIMVMIIIAASIYGYILLT